MGVSESVSYHALVRSVTAELNLEAGEYIIFVSPLLLQSQSFLK